MVADGTRVWVFQVRESNVPRREGNKREGAVENRRDGGAKRGVAVWRLKSRRSR